MEFVPGPAASQSSAMPRMAGEQPGEFASRGSDRQPASVRDSQPSQRRQYPYRPTQQQRGTWSRKEPVKSSTVPQSAEPKPEQPQWRRPAPQEAPEPAAEPFRGEVLGGGSGQASRLEDSEPPKTVSLQQQAALIQASSGAVFTENDGLWHTELRDILQQTSPQTAPQDTETTSINKEGAPHEAAQPDTANQADSRIMPASQEARNAILDTHKANAQEARRNASQEATKQSALKGLGGVKSQQDNAGLQAELQGTPGEDAHFQHSFQGDEQGRAAAGSSTVFVNGHPSRASTDHLGAATEGEELYILSGIKIKGPLRLLPPSLFLPTGEEQKSYWNHPLQAAILANTKTAIFIHRLPWRLTRSFHQKPPMQLMSHITQCKQAIQ